jgi:hypothetical protein
MDKIKMIEGLPDPMFEKPKNITYEDRDKMMWLLTGYGWSFYDKKTDNLYNEYCRLIMSEAYEYLLKKGFIDKNKNKIKQR